MNMSIATNRVMKAVGIVIVGLTLSTKIPSTGRPKRPKITDTIITLAYIFYA